MLSPLTNPIENVIVVGGAGAVGTMFADLLAASGLQTTVVDLPGVPIGVSGCSCRVVEGDILQSGPQLRAALGDADLVLLAVPENVACSAIPILASLVKPGALLVDTLSVKTNIAGTWSSVDADVEAVSLNPMFAPSLGAQGRPIAAVVLRDGPRARALLQMIETWGSRVVLMEPDEHDAATATVQALTHATILAFGLALQETGAVPAQLARVAPPPFQAMLALLARVVGGTSGVYWDIQDANPNAPAAREALSTGFRRLNDSLAQGESSFSEVFLGVREFLGPALSEHRDQGQSMLEALRRNIESQTERYEVTAQVTPEGTDTTAHLESLRAELDVIDEQFLDALRRRIECCVRIGLCKTDSGVAVMQPRRIAFVKERAARYGEQHGIDQEFLDRLYDLIIGETCRVEYLVMGLAAE